MTFGQMGPHNRSGSLKRFAKARLAWRVNVKESRFQELSGESVTWDTSGYAD